MPYRTPPLIRRAADYEAALWRSLYRWVSRRRPPVEPGAREFGNAAQVTPVLGVFIGLSAVEIPILDLILSHVLPWPAVRITALAVGVYGLVWMFGLLASLRVHPHVAGPGGFRLRYGATIDIDLPWDVIAEVRARYRSLPSSRTVQFTTTDAGRILNIGGHTSVDIVLRQPISFPLPKGPSGPVTEIRCNADEPDAVVREARRYLVVDLPAKSDHGRS